MSPEMEYLYCRLGYKTMAIMGRLFAKLYFLAPREMLQDELGLVQKKFTIKAHSFRKKAEELEERIIYG